MNSSVININESSTLSWPKKIYIKDFKDNLKLIFNPEGFGGPMLLKKNAWEYYELFRSTKYFELLQKFSNDGILIKYLNAFHSSDMLLIDGKGVSKNHNNGHLFNVWLQITNSCNLNCPYCYINKTDEDMKEELMWQVISKLEDEILLNGTYRGLRLKFGGGEPLLRFDLIKKVVEHFKIRKGKIPIYFSLITNGTIMNENIALFFAENNIPLSISIDGINDTNNRTRVMKSGKDTFEFIKSNLSILKKHNVNPFVLVTITSQNVSTLPELVNFLLENNLGFRFSLFKDYNVDYNYLVPNQELLLSKINECYDIIENNLLNFDYGRVHLNGMNFYSPYTHGCPVGRHTVTIDQNGNISLCQLLMDKPLGTFDDGIISKIQKQNQFTFRYQVEATETECYNCQWLNVCAGNCPLVIFKHKGSCLAKSPNCVFYKSVIPRIINILGLQMYNKYIN